MPYDANGVYQRPFTFVQDRNNGLKILATRMDAQFDDYKSALDRAFLRDGSVALGGDVNFNGFRPKAVANGTAAAPGYAFKDDVATGFYLNAAGVLGMAAGGVAVAGFSAAAATFVVGVDTTLAGIKVAGITGRPVFAHATPLVLADAATITPDMGVAPGLNFKVTLGGNRTIANPLNPPVGQSGVIIVAQDATGSRVPSFGSFYKWPDGGGVPTFSTGANAIDEIAYYVETASILRCTLTKNYGA